MRDLSEYASRRAFLARSGAGFGAVALHAMRQSEAQASGANPAAFDPLRPFAPRPPHFTPRARSVIFLFLVGGPSQIDSFDCKPELQRLDGQKTPESIRKAVEASRFANVFHGCKEELMASPFRFAQHGESGMWVSELWPNVARHVDDLCFIHSLQAESNNHAPASYQLHTGDVRPGKASLGSWVTYGLGSENQDLPAYVALFHAGPLGGSANYSNGFLPAPFQPTRLRDTGAPVLNLLPPDEFTEGQRESLDLIRRLNRKHRETHAGVSELDARIASYELAYRMQSAAMEVGDLVSETAAVGKEYRLDDREPRAASFGRKCLMARRLVERGVRFVQVYDMPDKDGWDAHGNLVENHVPRARWTDAPIAALLADLKRRGLLDSTLVICASEFGRTPMMQGDKGRQHNAAGFTIWLAGGGVKSGQRIGATDEIGLMAVERPIPFRDLHATILAALGLDNEILSFEVNGRPERLTGVADRAKVLSDLLG
ncbi:MAG: DUF1501 domain-containing protein [Planctomycetota bacterium]|nr:DUF1501 domain-containing protein [Planctomycetaceae bacterium]MDQ3329145.1 DUF1501 domain-containing protein [Planctomycetota bacterium]